MHEYPGYVQEECVGDDVWQAGASGMWYVLVPVHAARAAGDSAAAPQGADACVHASSDGGLSATSNGGAAAEGGAVGELDLDALQSNREFGSLVRCSDLVAVLWCCWRAFGG